MKRIIVILLPILVPLCALAHTENDDSVTNRIMVMHDSISLAVNIETLQKTIAEQVQQIKILSDSEKALKRKAYEDQQKMSALEERIKRLEQKLIFADSVVARVSNDCLRRKYDPIRVQDAILNFSRMYSPELQNKFGRLKTLLSEYGRYSQEIETILAEAQNDKSLNNPFTGHKQALAYIEKIKNTRYYCEVYDANWTILYLNNLIDRSIETLQSFNPKEIRTIKLLDLMH